MLVFTAFRSRPLDRQNILQEFQQRVLEMLRASPAADIERNLKALMAQSFNRLELVTRDEFDAQRELLRDLSNRVAMLEGDPGGPGSPVTGGAPFGAADDRPLAEDASPSETSPYDPPSSGRSDYGAPPAIDPRGSA